MDRQTIVITGFMGSGKTLVARALADLLRCTAKDLDEEITSAEGRTPGELIEQEGEAGFREIETRSLRRVLKAGTRVIALGGGAWTIPGNREYIAEAGCVSIWLDAPFEVCWDRIAAASGSRPLAPDHAKAKALYERRRSMYELATMRVEVTAESGADELARRVAEALDLDGTV
jgi:shikimate kinase